MFTSKIILIPSLSGNRISKDIVINSSSHRIYGMYKMSFLENKKEAKGIYFVVMGNIFKTPLELKVKYDLKGSLHGRTARKGNALMDRVVVLKDLDFNEDQMQLKLQPADRQIFLKQIERDSKFLASVNVNDYSLLLGIHFVPQCN